MRDWLCRGIQGRMDCDYGARVGILLSTSTAIDSKCMLQFQLFEVWKWICKAQLSLRLFSRTAGFPQQENLLVHLSLVARYHPSSTFPLLLGTTHHPTFPYCSVLPIILPDFYVEPMRPAIEWLLLLFY